MDELAVELGRDPMELREQNWIKHEEFPFTTVVGLTYDTGNYEQATDQAMATFDYAGLRREQEERRAQRRPGPARHRHLDLHRDVRHRALAAARLAGLRRGRLGGRVRSGCSPPARSRSITGASAHGQGHETAFSQIVADQLGVPFEDVEILHGDTQISPKGLDTYGSRSLVVGGIAIVNAAQKVVAKAKKLAAHLLEASEDDIEFANGTFTVRGTDKGKAIQEVAFAAFMAHDYPEDMEPSPRLRRGLRPGELLLPARHAPRGVEIDTETGHGRPAQVRLRGRRRHGRQPADRRGPGARRPRAGHRAGAVRRGQLRRPGHAGQRHVRRLHPAVGRRPAQLRHGRRLDAADVEPAGRQGRRRGGHHRLDAGHRQRRARRGAPPRRHGHRDADDVPARVAGHPGRPRATPPRRPRSTPTPRVPGWARSTRTTPRERSSDPRQVRLRQADVGRGRHHGAGRGRRGRQDPRRRPEPHPGAPAAARGPVGAHRPRWDRRAAGASARTATASSSGP